MVLIAGPSVGTNIFWSGMGCRPAALVLWRDWSRLPPPSASAQARPVLMMMAAGLAARGLMSLLHASPLWLAVLAVLAAGLGVWRWRFVSRYPQAFPAPRFASS